jgi:hypothetical protein
MKKIFLIILFYLVCLTQSTEYQAGDHDYLAMPNAFTLPQGKAYFSDYEVLFLNYGYAAWEGNQISIFSYFPVTTEVIRETFSLGMKQVLKQSKDFSLAAFTTIHMKTSVGIFGLVASFGDLRKNFSIGLTRPVGKGIDTNLDKNYYLFNIGGKISTPSNNAFLAEYHSSLSDLKVGILLAGFRFQKDDISWDIGGFRPIGPDYDTELIAFPYLKATFVF